ncbi:MAG: DUF1993 domain-containing protein [Deltaproteobacteria bacterium]|nr:DUF1993 domain-containing protein [Nannocystaceae bacterium]
MDLYTASVPQFIKMLRNLDSWLGKGIELAERKKFDPDVLLGMRLAADQFTLARQIQSSCDTAKLTSARLTGKDAPSHADSETTLAQLRERIASVVGWLETLGPADFAGASERKISAPWMRGKWGEADAYLVEYGWPNFYFHVVTAYTILRHAGVELGKIPYLGSFPFRD